jgi:hypothetical protein
MLSGAAALKTALALETTARFLCENPESANQKRAAVRLGEAQLA